ncbi:MAG: hypothetical protein N4A33_04775 [Bacteriovoracaceae bacterium]|jgi:hypothetical protein|nr:hypothetical protein [Bacteriovoracaceae bacterium]
MKQILIGLLALTHLYSYANECNINKIIFQKIHKNSLQQMIKDELRMKGYEVNNHQKGYKLSIGFYKRPIISYTSRIGYLKGNTLQNTFQNLDQAARKTTHYIKEVTSWRNYEQLILKDTDNQSLILHSKLLRRACIGNCGNWNTTTFDLRSKRKIIKSLLTMIPQCN